MSDKRLDYISWDEYFMGVAVLSGMRSKDPNTQVGACIVSKDNKILSILANDSSSRLNIDIYQDKITGYLSTTVKHFNFAKQNEFRDRVVHIKH